MVTSEKFNCAESFDKIPVLCGLWQHGVSC